MTFDRSQIPQSGQPRAFNFPKFERFTLANGLRVLHAPHRKLPLVTFQLITKNGGFTDPENQTGITAITAKMLMEGTKTHSVMEFSSALEFLAINMNTSSNWDASYFSVNSLKKHLSRAIGLFGEALFTPAFERDELDRQIKQHLNSRIGIKDDPAGLAAEALGTYLYPKTRYARPLYGFSPDIKKWSTSQLTHLHTRNYRPENSALVIVGDLDSSEIDTYFGPLLAQWENSLREDAPLPTVLENRQSTIVLINKPGAMQAQIRLGHPGINRTAPDYFDALLMNEILGGYFMSRLNMNLREDKGYTYGISSRFNLRKTAVPFIISAAVDAEKVSMAINEILMEMHKMQNEKVAEKELNDARGYLSGIFPVAFESGPQIAGGLSNIELYDLEDNYYRNLRNKLDLVNRRSIIDAAQKHLYPDSSVIIVVADRKVVESELRKKFANLQVVEIPEG